MSYQYQKFKGKIMHIYVNKLNNLCEMDKFLGGQQYQNWSKKKTGNPKSLLSVNDMEFIIKIFVIHKHKEIQPC